MRIRRTLFHGVSKLQGRIYTGNQKTLHGQLCGADRGEYVQPNNSCIDRTAVYAAAGVM